MGQTVGEDRKSTTHTQHSLTHHWSQLYDCRPPRMLISIFVRTNGSHIFSPRHVSLNGSSNHGIRCFILRKFGRNGSFLPRLLAPNSPFLSPSLPFLACRHVNMTHHPDLTSPMPSKDHHEQEGPYDLAISRRRRGDKVVLSHIGACPYTVCPRPTQICNSFPSMSRPKKSRKIKHPRGFSNFGHGAPKRLRSTVESVLEGVGRTHTGIAGEGGIYPQ